MRRRGAVRLGRSSLVLVEERSLFITCCCHDADIYYAVMMGMYIMLRAKGNLVRRRQRCVDIEV